MRGEGSYLTVESVEDELQHLAPMPVPHDDRTYGQVRKAQELWDASDFGIAHAIQLREGLHTRQKQRLVDHELLQRGEPLLPVDDYVLPTAGVVGWDLGEGDSWYWAAQEQRLDVERRLLIVPNRSALEGRVNVE